MDWHDIVSAVAPVVGIGGVIIAYLRMRTQRAVDAARAADRMDAMDRRIDDAHAKADKVQSGVDAGFEKLQATLDGFAGVLTKVQTTIAVLVDRDERPARPLRRRTTKTEI